jgi:hypothetical protein
LRVSLVLTWHASSSGAMRNMLCTLLLHPHLSSEGKDLVVAFTVKHEQNIDCGGAYIKVRQCYVDNPVSFSSL